MSTSTRRPHRKSRKGCRACKERKVKCDETRPNCKNCIRREEECVYNDTFASSLGPSAYHSQNGALKQNGIPPSTGSASHTSSSRMSIGGILIEQPGDHLYANGPHEYADLKLIWHYTVQLSTTDTRDPLVQEIRQKDMVEQALKHQFLMDALLAISALHYHTFGDRTEDWVSIAQIKRDRGLRTYIGLLEEIDERNCIAIFSFSTFVPVLFMASRPPKVDSEKAAEAVFEHARFLFGLQRGIATVMQKSAHLCLRDSRICRMMMRASQVTRHSLPQSTTNALTRLRDRCTKIKTEDSSNKAFELAISEMERILQSLSYCALDVDIDCEFVFLWPISSGPEYAELLRERDPAALAILAFYGAVVHHIRSLWFIGDWGKQITQAACTFLDSTWDEVTRWAQDEVMKR